MQERPILFSGEMVKAILDGCKTQTRRVIKQCIEGTTVRKLPDGFGFDIITPRNGIEQIHGTIRCPYGAPGDGLWVRESFRCDGHGEHGAFSFRYKADNNVGVPATTKYENGGKWRPSIHMPRIASRITLEIVNVRVERVQDISDSDAIAEGVNYWSNSANPARFKFMTLWDRINSSRGYSWDTNPFVWVVEFKRI